MAKSESSKVLDFINKIKMVDPSKHKVLEGIRKIVFEHYPKIKEHMMYGGILFKLDEDVAGVFVYKHHVSLEFSYGYKFEDPDKLLDGGGQYRRHLKFKSMDEVQTKNIDFFVKQIGLFDQ